MKSAMKSAAFVAGMKIGPRFAAVAVNWTAGALLGIAVGYLLLLR